MTRPRTGTRGQWLAARLELLEAEKELTRCSDELARRRRQLHWVPVEKDYVFGTHHGDKTLRELFAGRSQLLVYHFMFGPQWPKGSVARLGFGGLELQLRVDRLTAGHRIEWTCLNDFPMPPGRWAGTTVTWDLTSGDSGVELLLQHGSWPADIAQTELAGTAYTWALVLTALKGYAETGTPQPVFGPHAKDS